MKRAIKKLIKKPQLVLIDGNKLPKIVNYNEKKIPNPDIKHMIENFEKITETD